MALSVHNLLANGSGGIDWAGLPIVCAWLGIADVQGLLQRLAVIKTWRKPADRPNDTPAPAPAQE